MIRLPLDAGATRFALPGALALAVLAAPTVLSSSLEYDLSVVACYAVAVIGLNVITGLAGQISFATTAFMAVGGYASAILTVREGWNPWLALLAGAGAAAALAVVLGAPILRLRGHYLAMGTFALALAAEEYATADTGVTGGPVGVSGVPSLSIGPLQLSGGTSFYLLAWGLVIAAMAGTWSLNTSRIGRAWGALGEREDVARSLGVDVWRLKLAAFAVAATLAAVGGSLYVELTQFASPDLYSPDIAVQVFAMLFVGGVGSVYGPVIGAAVITLLPLIFSSLQSSATLLVELVVLAVLIVMPRGLTSVMSGLISRARAGRVRTSATGLGR